MLLVAFMKVGIVEEIMLAIKGYWKRNYVAVKGGRVPHLSSSKLIWAFTLHPLFLINLTYVVLTLVVIGASTNTYFLDKVLIKLVVSLSSLADQ